METIFKVGQKVYDQVHYPDYEGKVIKIYEDSILVIFEGVENYYSLDGRSGDSLPTLSTKPYKVEFQGFEQESNQLIKEALVWSIERNLLDKRTTFDETIYYPKEEGFEAFEALRELLILKRYYNDGCVLDLLDQKELFTIVNSRGILDGATTYEFNRVLKFKTKEIRDKFLKEQRELLEIAKPLL